MVERIVNRFDGAMKKGFINIQIMLILEKEPSHGYKIKSDISKRTFGVWEPSDSTIYTALKNLSDIGLIETIKQKETDRGKKIYRLTTKGKKALELMVQKQKEMRNSMRSMITSTIGLMGLSEEEVHQITQKPMFFNDPFLEPLEEHSIEDNIKKLTERKEFLLKRKQGLENMIQNFEKKIQNIDNMLLDLKKKQTKSN